MHVKHGSAMKDTFGLQAVEMGCLRGARGVTRVDRGKQERSHYFS